MANTSRSYPKRARQSTGSQESTTSTNTYSTARRPRRSAPYNSSGTSRSTASSRNLLSQTTRGGTNLLIDESTLGVPCQKYTKVLRYTSSPLDIPYFGSSPNGTFKIPTWVKVSELTEEERNVYNAEEMRKDEQRLIWKKELEKKSTAAADVDIDNKEKQQSVEVDKKRKRDDDTNVGDDDTSAATGDNDKADDNDGTSTTENVNKSEVDVTADGDDIDINKGMVKEEDGDVTMDDNNNTGTNNGNDETGSKSIKEQQQGEQKEVVAKEESEDVAAVAGEAMTDKSKEEEREDGKVSSPNSEVVNIDVEMNEDGTNLDKATKTEDNKTGGDTKEEEEVKSIQVTASQ